MLPLSQRMHSAALMLVCLNGTTSFCQMVCSHFEEFILTVLQHEDVWQHMFYPGSIPQSVICAFAHRCCAIA